ncbi:MAG: arylsulfatase [Planctomycetaceae bacterium]
MRTAFVTSLVIVRMFFGCPSIVSADESRPNIVVILCDDLGYGDVHCLVPGTCRIATPCADQLAAEGMIFTDAHSGSSVCTPTRYGLLTGRYSWRTTLQHGVVTGYEPSLIAEDRPTVASFLKAAGYDTAIIGKWHLNFNYTHPKTQEILKRKDHKLPPIGSRITDGPISRGFDFYHGFHHAREMKAVIENQTVIQHDDEINMLPRLTRESERYIRQRSASDPPFFLYIPLGSPHTPIVPSAAWQGRSRLGPYGDFVMETDAVVGAVCDVLKERHLDENTLVILTSDNGCSKAADIQQLAKLGHIVSGPYRGSKADLWDGGHRVPFIAKWPGRIAPSSHSDQLICHVDLFATMADIIGRPLPADSAEDSVSYLPAFRGEPIQTTRKGVIHHSISGHFAYRLGPWKLLLAKGSGGWSSPTEKQAAKLPKVQLYNMQTDPAETTSLAEQHPEIVEQLLTQLTSDVRRGRSTDGPDSSNDVNGIQLWKTKPRE